MWELTTDQICIIGLHILWISRRHVFAVAAFSGVLSLCQDSDWLFHGLVKWWWSIRNVYTRVIYFFSCRKHSQLHRTSRPNCRFVLNPYRAYFYLQLHLTILHSSHFAALIDIYCQTARFPLELCACDLVVKGGYAPFSLCVLALIQTISVQFKFICFATCPGPQKLWLSWIQEHTSIPPEY